MNKLPGNSLRVRNDKKSNQKCSTLKATGCKQLSIPPPANLVTLNDQIAENQLLLLEEISAAAKAMVKVGMPCKAVMVAACLGRLCEAANRNSGAASIRRSRSCC